MEPLELQIIDFDRYISRKDLKSIFWVRFNIDELTQPFMYHLSHVEKLIYFELIFQICAQKNTDTKIDIFSVAQKLSTSSEIVSNCVNKLIHHKVLKLKKNSKQKSERPRTDPCYTVQYSTVEYSKEEKENITKEKTLQQVVGDSVCGAFTLDKEVSTQDIELLYAKYPRKEGKTKGMQKLQKQIKTKQDLADLAKAIEVYSKLSAGKERQFIKHFATFASCWKDYLQEGIESDNKPVKQDDNLLNSFSEKWSQS